MRREEEQYLRSIPELTPIHTAKSPFTEFVVVIEIVRRRAQFLQRKNPPRGGILPPPLPPAKPKQLFFTRSNQRKSTKFATRFSSNQSTATKLKSFCSSTHQDPSFLTSSFLTSHNRSSPRKSRAHQEARPQQKEKKDI